MMISSFTLTVKADDYLTPKREMRSAWVVTAWGIDWPSTKITSTGNETQIAAQKNELTTMLDSLKMNNMNAINIQVRSMCDAMYESSYEPWSSYLSGTRGLDPGYDPLAFAVEECHKRGMECHAWINPYRYSTGSAWSTDQDKELEASGLLLTTDIYTILNPGREESIERIVNVCREVVTKYDVDGILYDDYFYISGTLFTQDEDLYNAYKAEGGTLGQSDWRRDNVNRMIEAVYNMIQEEKPWVRFGVAPAGAACTDESVANQYGVTASPGSDWQYSSIYSDPMAWISSHTVDYISPQLYWTIGHTTDYAEMVPWWSMVAEKFGRHFYSSQSITSLTSTSTSTTESVKDGASILEQELINQTYATGPNNDTFNEYADQVMLNRECSLDGAPGSVFYSVKYFYKLARLFGHYMKNTVFTEPSLLPAMTWKESSNPGLVTGLALNDNKLTWDSYDNVRYTVYAVPTSVADADFNQDIEYLLEVSYEAEYEIPADYQDGYKYAVAVLDRMGYEYSAVFEGAAISQLDAPALVSPANGENTSDPFLLTWGAVENATSYQLELCANDEFTSDVYKIVTDETEAAASSLDGMANGDILYWRVRSMATNYNDGVSEIYSIIPQILEVTYPADNSTGISITPEITWVADEGINYTVEIATKTTFDESALVYSAVTTKGSYTIPSFTLTTATTYYVRVLAELDEIETESDYITFKTEDREFAVPVVVSPEDGGDFYENDVITYERQDGLASFTIEIAASESFPVRSKYVQTINDFGYQTAAGGDITISGSNLVVGTTYYYQSYATYYSTSGTSKTDTSDIRTFVYVGDGSGVDSNIAEASVKVSGTETPVLGIAVANSSDVYAVLYNAVGVSQGVLYNGKVDSSIEIPLSSLEKGIYLVSVTINGVNETVKFIR